IDVRRAGRHLDLSLLTDPCERVVLDEEGGVLDRLGSVAGDEERALIDSGTAAASLTFDARRAHGPDQARGDEHQGDRFQSTHWSVSSNSKCKMQNAKRNSPVGKARTFAF